MIDFIQTWWIWGKVYAVEKRMWSRG